MTTLDEIVKAARDLIAAPDLKPFHDGICAYIRDHGGLVFAYSPPGNTRNLIQFESTPDGQYSFFTPDEEYRLNGSREVWTKPSDPVFEKLFADSRAAEMDVAQRRERFEKLFPETSVARAALVVALRAY